MSNQSSLIETRGPYRREGEIDE